LLFILKADSSILDPYYLPAFNRGIDIMGQIEQDLKEIKEKLELLCNHFGVGKVRPTDAREIRERAKKKANQIISKQHRSSNRRQKKRTEGLKAE
jgi:hypothetical protein